MPYFTEPEEVLDYVHNLIETNKTVLGLKFVGYADEKILPVYPAAVISYNAPVERNIHSTSRQFQLLWAIQIIVYHARLSTSHKTRSREDMALATAIREKLHEDYQLGGGVIFGFVQSERPGLLADDKGQANVATTLIWTGESRAPF